MYLTLLNPPRYFAYVPLLVLKPVEMPALQVEFIMNTVKASIFMLLKTDNLKESYNSHLKLDSHLINLLFGYL